jgi:hypothetical protein
VVRLEAWARKHWAGRTGDSEGEAHFRRLGALVADLSRGKKAAARRRLNACVRDWERRGQSPYEEMVGQVSTLAE